MKPEYFSKITHIEEVLPHLEGRKEFTIGNRETFTYIDYNYVLEDTFDDDIRRECRGIKFDRDGYLLARPLPKFFNYGEKSTTIDIRKPHKVMEKLDGSMVHPVVIDGRFNLMTRAGLTEVAEKAEECVTAELEEWCREQLNDGNTPVFEYTAPDNQIVIKYDNPRLTLIAIRDSFTGSYLELAGCEVPARIVHTFNKIHDLDLFVSGARKLIGQEGYVVRFNTGESVKIKADDYVMRHRAMGSFIAGTQDKHLLALILAGGVDDLVPVLSTERAAQLLEYQDRVNDFLMHCQERIAELQAPGVDRKVYATELVPTLPAYLRGAAFAAYSGKPVREALINTFNKNVPEEFPKWV
jgi:RNA ligase